MMISTRLVELVIDTVVCLTLAKWETVSGQFGGYLNRCTGRRPGSPLLGYSNGDLCHVGERSEKQLITAFCDKIAELSVMHHSCRNGTSRNNVTPTSN